MASRERRPGRETFCLALFVASVLGLVLVLTGCHTYEAVVETPEEVWIHLELILLGVWCDFVELIDLFL